MRAQQAAAGNILELLGIPLIPQDIVKPGKPCCRRRRSWMSWRRVQANILLSTHELFVMFVLAYSHLYLIHFFSFALST